MNTLSYLFSSLRQLPQTTLLGEVKVPGPNKHFKRTPTDWILYMVSEGTMIIREDEQEYHLTAGDILMLSPGKCHFGLPVNDSVHYFYIHFYWNTLEEITLTTEEYQQKKIYIQEEVIAQVGETSQPDYLLLPKFFHPDTHIFQEVIEDIRQLLHVSQKALPHQQSMNECLFLMILLKLSRWEMFQLLPQNCHSFSSTLPIMAYLKEHHREKIRSKTLEQEFHHNFDYMNRKFKENTGTTIFQFLEKYRIEESKKLLESKRFSITEIAEILGFCNAYYFTKVFKKHESITPKEYKKSHH